MAASLDLSSFGLFSPSSSFSTAGTSFSLSHHMQLGCLPLPSRRRRSRWSAPSSASGSRARVACACEETLNLLKSCQLSVREVNPRQYTADIPQLPNLEVWFQRPKDIVRKLHSGDLDLGDVGLDTVSEHGQLGTKILKEKGLKHVTFSTADGALESYPVMGTADAILDLVSSGTTLRENNLKEIEGGIVLESQAVLVASRRSFNTWKGVLEITQEMLERLEAHLRATGEIMVTANIRGNNAEEIAERVLSQTSLSGLQGPTVSPVFCLRNGKVMAVYYAINICVPFKELYKSIQQLRSVACFLRACRSPNLRTHVDLLADDESFQGGVRTIMHLSQQHAELEKCSDR